MCVVGGDRRVRRVLGDLVAVQECGVPGAAQAPRRAHEQGSLGRSARIERADAIGVRLLLVPGDPEVGGSPAQLGDDVRVGRGQRAKEPHARLDHHVGGGHAGEQRHLGVPALDGQGDVVHEVGVAVFVALNLLRGQGEAHRPPVPFEGGSEQSDLLEEGEDLAAAAIGLDLRIFVCQGLVDPDPCPSHPGSLEDAVFVEVEHPEHRRSILAGQQAGGAFADQFRMQRRAAIRGVQRHTAGESLGLQGTSRAHEGGDVGDGVVDAISRLPPLGPEGLVEVT